MKRFLAFTAAFALSLNMVACGADRDNNPTDTVDSTGYKVGVGSYTTTENSRSSSEGEKGKGDVSTTYVTVIFDNNDIIKKVYIDEVESKIYFDSKGQLDEGKNNTNIRSKRELGDSYGMKAASPISKEWYQQINSLEDYLVGKNLRHINDYVVDKSYGPENDYSTGLGNNDTSNDNMTDNNIAENATDDILNGAKGIINGIADGARNIIGKNSANSSTNDGTDTAEGITNNTDNTVNNNSAENDITNENVASGNNQNSAVNINWEEDLKSSVTIDMTNIQRALQKAYLNAR